MKSESRPASRGKGFRLAAFLIIIFVGVVPIRHVRSGKVVLPVEPPGVGGGSSDQLNSDKRSAKDADGGTRPYQRRSGNAHPASLKVQPFQGQYCAAVGPPGWSVLDENAQRAGFGADFASGDRMAYAGYSIFPSGALTGGSGTPEQGLFAGGARRPRILRALREQPLKTHSRVCAQLVAVGAVDRAPE